MTSVMFEINKKNKFSPSLDKKFITIGSGCRITLSDIALQAKQLTPLNLSKESYAKIEQSYQLLKSCVDQRKPIYGISTSFGDQVSLVDPNLKKDDAHYYASIQARQKNIIKNLACGQGEIIPKEIVRLTMMLRAHCLAQGFSGVSLETIQKILECLNAGITPCVRRYGSIGASGDLIPLATIAAALLGEPVDVFFQDQIMPASNALQKANIKKLEPIQRDGLALINGTSFMTTISSLALYDLHRLFRQMLSAIAMALESMLVISGAYHPLVHQVKGHIGEIEINDFFLQFWEGSQLLSHFDEVQQKNESQDSSRPLQDYYSLRSVPQGFGPFYENLKQAIHWIENEINSVNDNPIIDISENKIHHCANFMGYYITDACDILKMNIAQASTWIHALLSNLVHARKNHQLPTNLVEHPEKNNGFRAMQLLAAALSVQNRKLAQSQQAFMLPTEGDNQDVNSLGTHAALDFQEAVKNLERLTAILLLASCQALEFRSIKKAGKRSQEIYHALRRHSPTLVECRVMSDEIQHIVSVLAAEEI